MKTFKGEMTHTQLAAFIDSHKDELAAISTTIATNYDVPAQRIINAGFAKMNVDRFDSEGNDLWEMIQCYRNGWAYEKPSARLAQRWASY